MFIIGDNPCLAVVVQSCMEWIKKKKCLGHFISGWFFGDKEY